MEFSSTSFWTDRAVIGKIMREHEKLRRIHSAIDDTVEKLESLLRDLELHFLHEETDGFFQEITDKAPRLVDRARMLCEEHRRMLSDAAELCRFAAAGSPSVPWWLELQSRCHAFSKRLMQHESDECALLQEAHQRDLGLGN